MNHINIEMPCDDKILSDNMLIDQTVVLKGQELIVDLIMFEMPSFDTILGMDFINRYRAKIDCKNQVKFNLENGDEFFFGES